MELLKKMFTNHTTLRTKQIHSNLNSKQTNQCTECVVFTATMVQGVRAASDKER